MISFFEKLWAVIANVIEFFSQTIRSFVMLYDMVGDAIAFPLEIANFVPAFLLTSIYVVIFIGALKLIIGRGNT